MSAAPAPGGEVEFRVRTVSIEERSPLALLDPAAPRSGELVRACGWCKRLDAGGRWVEAEEAAARLRLMERSPLPMITHGICADCETDMLRTLEP